MFLMTFFYILGISRDSCQYDWVELYNMFPDDSSQLIGRYCGISAPGPVISEMGSNTMKIILNTDKEGVASGFKVRYFFETRGSVFGGKFQGFF